MSCGIGIVKAGTFAIHRSANNILLGGRVDHVAIAVRDGAAEPSGFAVVLMFHLLAARHTPCSWLFERGRPPVRQIVPAANLVCAVATLPHGYGPNGRERVRAILPPVFGQIAGV